MTAHQIGIAIGYCGLPAALIILAGTLVNAAFSFRPGAWAGRHLPGGPHSAPAGHPDAGWKLPADDHRQWKLIRRGLRWRW
jgi:hypothetical protein